MKKLAAVLFISALAANGALADTTANTANHSKKAPKVVMSTSGDSAGLGGIPLGGVIVGGVALLGVIMGLSSTSNTN